MLFYQNLAFFTFKILSPIMSLILFEINSNSNFNSEASCFHRDNFTQVLLSENLYCRWVRNLVYDNHYKLSINFDSFENLSCIREFCFSVKHLYLMVSSYVQALEMR